MRTKILRGGDRLFDHPAVLRFYRQVLRSWEPEKPVALLMGCSAAKPYSTSFIHAKTMAALERHDLSDRVQQYIIGEPLIACPREWETRYPAAHYDFPPDELGTDGRVEFVERLQPLLIRLRGFHDSWLVFAPNHHLGIIKEAWDGGGNLPSVPYNVYKLPILVRKLRRMVRDAL